MNDETIKKILGRDALAETEELTGASYKESEFTMQLGLLNHLEATADKERAMLATGDTAFSCSLSYYMSVAESIGFKTVLEVPFTTKSAWDERARNEKLFVLWRDGILLVFDTYNTDGVNGGNFYYNWQGSREKHFNVLSSGGPARNDLSIWVGHHDCREGLKFHIRQLEAHGRLLPKWVERPFMWLLHHGDTANNKPYDYKAINTERIALLPREVREAISPVV